MPNEVSSQACPTYVVLAEFGLKGNLWDVRLTLGVERTGGHRAQNKMKNVHNREPYSTM